MKKVLALVLALVFVLSLVACGEKKYTKDEVEKALKELFSEVELKESANQKNEFNYSNDKSDYSVKTDNNGNATEIKIAEKGIDTSYLNSGESVNELIDKTINNPGKCTYGEHRASVCIADVLCLACLFDESYNNKTMKDVADAIINGNAQFGTWKVLVNKDSNNELVIITAKPT